MGEESHKTILFKPGEIYKGIWFFFPYCRAKFKLPPESAYFSALLQSFDCATCPQT